MKYVVLLLLYYNILLYKTKRTGFKIFRENYTITQKELHESTKRVLDTMNFLLFTKIHHTLLFSFNL